MERTSHRRYLAWMAWRKKQWNEPDRHDHYIMALCQEVRASWTRKFEDLAKFFVPFVFKKPETQEEREAREQAQYELDLERSKSRWFGITGYKKQ